MDTSEIYIKMCDCEEIQGQWKLDQGDYYFSSGDTADSGQKANREVRILTISKHVDYQNNALQGGFPCTEHGTGHKEEYIWLPRQDQIQEMIGKSKWFSSVLDIFYIYITDNNQDYMNIYDVGYNKYSIEQVWLMLYMDEKHNKKWDGEEWRK